MDETLHEAAWQVPAENGAVRCGLCPRECVVPPDKTGFCQVRKNHDGKMYAAAYGLPAAIQIDPIEKKPLRHYLPGTKTFSVGCYGCNLGCVFCQNDHLSRGNYNPRARYRHYEPEELAELAKRHSCDSIAFTYNEPTVWAEYVIHTAKAARERGLGTVLVTNGYITEAAAAELYPLMEAANIDVKGFTEEFYREMCHASLDPVKRACEYYKNVAHGHLELTELVIPGKNDAWETIEAYLDWVGEKLGTDTPLHFTAYHPAYLYSASPPTPVSMLRDIREFARSKGFPNVYLGNI